MNANHFHARHEGLLDPTVLATKRILVVGAGSVGSLLCEFLVRAGVMHLIVIDKDVVEVTNLCRTVYSNNDVGKPKVEALKERLVRIRPDVRVDARHVDVETIEDDELEQLISSVSLVVAVTDHPTTQLRCAVQSYHSTPAVFAGVYEKGIGGEVIFTLPEETACYLCILGELAKGNRPTRGRLAYGMTPDELIAEPALGVDIAHVTACAAKVALALVLRGTAAPAASILDPSRNLLLVGNSVEWVWRSPFETDWVRTQRRSSCLCSSETSATCIDMEESGDAT